MQKKSKLKNKILDIEEDIKPNLYRWFTFIFYEDSKSYDINDVFLNIRGFKQWAYIKHLPEQDEAKLHYHCIVYVQNATTISAISKRTGIPENHIKFVKSVRSMCRYLTHIDFPDKIQYTLNDVVVSKSFDRKFRKHFEDIKSEDEIIDDIYSWIDNYHFKSYLEKQKQLILYINFNCYDTVYKRYRYEFNDYMKENV